MPVEEVAGLLAQDVVAQGTEPLVSRNVLVVDPARRHVREHHVDARERGQERGGFFLVEGLCAGVVAPARRSLESAEGHAAELEGPEVQVHDAEPLEVVRAALSIDAKLGEVDALQLLDAVVVEVAERDDGVHLVLVEQVGDAALGRTVGDDEKLHGGRRCPRRDSNPQ